MRIPDAGIRTVQRTWADVEAVTSALLTMHGGASKYHPGGEIKFDDNGHRVGAGLAIIQRQMIYSDVSAMAKPV
ncbi:MAG: hypothetical protein J2P54_20395 [Bradyrhizobiaceae bacterium]|nr:hypothetical protein [Bradyrhizobiaceae bacterium]